eukprot:TRINITY_DN15738_c0_g1_i1.p1 TRINITY_DN15738_c0_g1~~TRINITY_DN15738_c0_g1_i1.p1  ORF type:complete len:391 (+),score=84.46 TRINITY_DN15738_c0_g1_i1:686-1858(+)
MSEGGSGDETVAKKPHGFKVEKVEIPSYPSGPGNEGGGKPPELRLYEEGKKWQAARSQRLDRKRAELEAEKREGETSKPWVTDMAKEVGRDNFDQFIVFQEKWAKDLEVKKQKEKSKVASENAQKVREEGGDTKWQMSKGSQEIMQHSLHDSPSSKTGWRKNLAKYLRNKESGVWRHEEQPSFKPSINDRSHGLDRHGDVGERLHKSAKQREEQMELKRNGGKPSKPKASRNNNREKKRAVQEDTGVVVTDDDYKVEDAGKGSSFEMYATRMRVAELAEALEFEIGKNRSFDKLSREVHKEAEYLTAALRKERERNDLLALELQHERAKTSSLQQALSSKLTSRNIGAPLVPPVPPEPISISLSPRRCLVTPSPSPPPRQYVGAINLDDL